jgi:sugar phosphate isomerase/epimerase
MFRLRSLYVLLALLAIAAPLRADGGRQSGADKLGWRLAIQAWTNNQATLFETIELAQRLGIRYVEAFPGQKLRPEADGAMGPEMSRFELKLLGDKLRECHVKIINYGVTGIPEDEQGARDFFTWATAIDIETIVAEPSESQVPMLDRLAEEYGKKIAIHNHPQPSHYWSPETVLAAVAGASPRVGACADTGHWVRSGLDPIECLRKLRGRIVSLHFKDLSATSGDMHDVPWGTGASRAKRQLTELARQEFHGVFSIEYEYQWDEATLLKCVQFFNKTADELAK